MSEDNDAIYTSYHSNVDMGNLISMLVEITDNCIRYETRRIREDSEVTHNL